MLYSAELYAALYYAEESVFTPCLVKQAFKNTWLFLFDGKRMMRKVQENLGDFAPTDDNKGNFAIQAAATMTEVLRDEINKSKPDPEGVVAQKKTMMVSCNSLHSPWALQAYHASKDMEKKWKRDEKDVRLAEQAREEQEKKLMRERRRCIEEVGGGQCPHYYSGGKGWKMCEFCCCFLCPKHARQVVIHECRGWLAHWGYFVKAED